MLTVKLRNLKSNALRIIECQRVDIVPQACGDVVLTVDGSAVTDRVSDKPGFIFNIAYVENAQGNTTQIVRPGGR